MAHPSLQIGAALVVPFVARHRTARSGPNQRFRALREATSAVGRDGGGWRFRKRRRKAASPSVPARLHAPAEAAGE